MPMDIRVKGVSDIEIPKLAQGAVIDKTSCLANQGDYTPEYGFERPTNSSNRLLNLNYYSLEVRKATNGKIIVSYESCEVQDGCMLKSIVGCGNTFEEACDDYLHQISGHTLIFNAMSETKRKEVNVL
jgi:hypothetical protein